MPWRQFVMELAALDPDAVEAIFEKHGAQSITLTDAGDDPQLEPGRGETPLWKNSRITGLFPSGQDFADLQSDLMRTLGIPRLPRHDIVDLEDRFWEREWLKYSEPMVFGERLWIYPGDTVVNDDAAVVVRLDPGLAFGTGTHATTALCLEWLSSQRLEQKNLLDYGCGSGVLAIAGLRLGAHSATAMDIDPQALTATHDNASRNGVAESLSVVGSDTAISGAFDVVVANILAGPLIVLAERIAARVRGGCLLALSGILSEQVDDVLSAYQSWITFDEPVLREQDGQTWARLTGLRNTN
jgi:ribosomal protein L11 methyltransferase